MSEEKLVRRRRIHRESPGRRFLRDFRFELVWLLVVAAGLFLVFEQLSLRETVATWAREWAHGLLQSATEIDRRIDAFLAQVSISDLVGFLLILGAAVAILLRIRWRLQNTPGLTALECPRCGGGIHRSHRTGFDRLIGLYVPVRRYRCRDSVCGWKGLRVGRGHAISASTAMPPTAQG